MFMNIQDILIKTSTSKKTQIAKKLADDKDVILNLNAETIIAQRNEISDLKTQLSDAQLSFMSEVRYSTIKD